MKNHVAILALFVSAFWGPLPAAASDAQVDKMTTYAVVLGRAVACGVNISPEMQRVGAWMDKVFPPGSSDQRIYLPVFVTGVKHHAKQQQGGKSPDSCADVRAAYSNMSWP